MRGSFADSNIFLYLAGDDPEKAATVEVLLGLGLTISVQVLNEIANVLRRKRGFAWAGVHEFLETVEDLTSVHPLSVETHKTGIVFAERYRLSIYDAMIVSSALLAGCDTLYTEDMHHGLVVDDRLRIVDPFR
jgi:predicted nucleic acid-binding protein